MVVLWTGGWTGAGVWTTGMGGDTQSVGTAAGSEKTLEEGSAEAEEAELDEPFLTIRRAGVSRSLAGAAGRPTVALIALVAVAAATEGSSEDWATGTEVELEA